MGVIQRSKELPHLGIISNRIRANDLFLCNFYRTGDASFTAIQLGGVTNVYTNSFIWPLHQTVWSVFCSFIHLFTFCPPSLRTAVSHILFAVTEISTLSLYAYSSPTSPQPCPVLRLVSCVRQSSFPGDKIEAKSWVRFAFGLGQRIQYMVGVVALEPMVQQVIMEAGSMW